MIRYKLYGILSLFIITLPKFFSTSFEREDPNQTQLEAGAMPYVTEFDFEFTKKSTPQPIEVSASVYFPEEAQTDSTPFITADGSKINQKRPRKHRWVAVSRNLLRKWGGNIDYGDTLHVQGISNKLDGTYVVRDTMTRRIKNRIDILVGQDDEIMGFWDKVTVVNLN